MKNVNQQFSFSIEKGDELRMRNASLAKVLFTHSELNPKGAINHAAYSGRGCRQDNSMEIKNSTKHP